MDGLAIAAGDGTLWTWGANPAGELGLGTPGDILQPTQVMSFPPLCLVAAHERMLVALASDGRVWTPTIHPLPGGPILW